MEVKINVSKRIKHEVSVIWSFSPGFLLAFPFLSISRHFDSLRLRVHYVDIIRLVCWRKVRHYGLCIYIKYTDVKINIFLIQPNVLINSDEVIQIIYVSRHLLGRKKDVEDRSGYSRLLGTAIRIRDVLFNIFDLGIIFTTEIENLSRLQAYRKLLPALIPGSK